TLIGVLITNKMKLYMQIGDGNILEVSKDIEIIEYNKKNKVRGVLNSMYLDDAYLYIDIKFNILENEDLKSVVLFSDGFTNSFGSLINLSESISSTIEGYKKSVFSRYNLKKQYKNYLEYLTLNKSKDDITIAFIF
ncbi:MAG: protein phosphatase 2C domain-containing protein, partial [Paeniclostridium sp.]